MGLLPGFSPPTSDLNTTVGLALVSFIGYNVIGIKEMGAGLFKTFCRSDDWSSGAEFSGQIGVCASPATLRGVFFRFGICLPSYFARFLLLFGSSAT